MSLVSRVVFECGLTIEQSRVLTFERRACDEFQISKTDGSCLDRLERCILVDRVYFALSGDTELEGALDDALELASSPY